MPRYYIAALVNWIYTLHIYKLHLRMLISRLLYFGDVLRSELYIFFF